MYTTLESRPSANSMLFGSSELPAEHMAFLSLRLGLLGLIQGGAALQSSYQNLSEALTECRAGALGSSRPPKSRHKP